MSLPQYFDAATYGDKAQAMNDLATKKMQEMYGTAGDAMSRRDTRKFNRWMRKEGVDQIEREMINPTAPANTPANTEKQSFIPSQEEYIKQQYGTNASRRDIRQVRRNWGNTVLNLANQKLMGLQTQMESLLASQNAETSAADVGAGAGDGAVTPAASTWKHVVPQQDSMKGLANNEWEVQKGNTLIGIVNSYNKDNGLTGDQALKWQDVAAWNNITADNKYMIKPGQRISFTNPNAGTVVGAEEVAAQKQGGLIKRHQQGGQQLSPEQQELQYALVGYIVATKKQPKDENEIKQIAQQLMQLKQQDPQKYSQLVQLGQQAQAQKAEKGAKLNYIKSLKGQCPDGEELVYFKKGGMIDCGCQKKEKGGAVKPAKKANAIEEFKKGRKSKKC